MTTRLLSHNELLDHVRASGAYRYPLYSSADVLPYASKQSGPGQMWVDRQYFLHHNLNTDSFIYCEEEQDLRCEESGDHPIHLEEKATSIGVTSGGYVKVQSIPCAYDQGAEAKQDDPESAPLVWFWHPHLLGVASSDIGRRIPHLFCGSGWGSTWLRERPAIYTRAYYMDFIFGV